MQCWKILRTKNLNTNVETFEAKAWKSHLPGTLTWSLKDPKSCQVSLRLWQFLVFMFSYLSSASQAFSQPTVSQAFHRKNLPKARLKTWWKWSWVGMRRISCFAMTSNKKTKSFKVEALGKLSSFSWFDVFEFRGVSSLHFFFPHSSFRRFEVLSGPCAKHPCLPADERECTTPWEGETKKLWGLLPCLW